MADAPKFARFFKSVEGRAVARYDSGSSTRACEFIGAVRDGRNIVWDTDKITPLTEDYCRRYVRELNQAVRRGELVEVTRAEYEASIAPDGAESED